MFPQTAQESSADETTTNEEPSEGAPVGPFHRVFFLLNISFLIQCLSKSGNNIETSPKSL